MTPLRSPQVAAFSEALEHIHTSMVLSEFPQRVFEVAHKLFPGCFLTIDEFNTRTHEARHAVNVQTPEGWGERIAELVPLEHPSYFALLKGAREPLRLSDLTTQREFRRTALEHEVFAPMRIRHQLALPLFIPDHVAGVTVNRDRPFTDEELCLARLLSPHLALAHQHAQTLTRLRLQQRQETPEAAMLRTIGLTRRESEVMHWLIQGKRDAEIALLLRAKPRTIEKHVQNIFQKLSVETRTAAATEALRRLGL